MGTPKGYATRVSMHGPPRRTLCTTTVRQDCRALPLLSIRQLSEVQHVSHGFAQ